MSSNWLTVTVDDIKSPEKYSCVGGPFGSSLSRKHYVEEIATPVIRGVNLSGDIFSDKEFVYVSKEKGKELSRNLAYPGDLVFTQRGTLGQVALIPANAKFPSYVVSQSQMKLTVNPEVAAPYFVYVFFRSKQAKESIERNAIVGGVPHINLGILKAFEIPLPPLCEQQKIVNVIRSIDEKITLNTQTNQTLEQMAQALFKSWFVDFDPVIDNALAAGNPIPEPLAERARTRQALFADTTTAPARLPAETLALFPESFEEHPDMGWIPAGWEVRSVGDVIENVGGATPKTSEPLFWDNGSHAFCTPKDMSNLDSKVILDTERKLTVDGVNKISSGQLAAGTVVMSSRAPIGYLAITKLPISVNQGIIALKPDDQFGSEFLLFWLEANQKEVITRANGSTFLEISKKNFRTIPFLIPPKELCLHYNDQAKACMDAVYCNTKQMQELTKLRDTLLPKLLSGELSLPELEAKTGTI